MRIVIAKRERLLKTEETVLYLGLLPRLVGSLLPHSMSYDHYDVRRALNTFERASERLDCMNERFRDLYDQVENLEKKVDSLFDENAALKKKIKSLKNKVYRPG